MDTTTIKSAETTATEPKAITVKLFVCHGDYRANFYGTGATILEAAEAAALQTSYSHGLFDTSDYLWAQRAGYREGLVACLETGGTYRNFGWCDFSRIS